MPYKTPKMTPKAASRARAVGQANARTRRQLTSKGSVSESGVGNIPASLLKLGITAAKALKSNAKPNAAAGVSSRTKRSTGFMSSAYPGMANVSKRRVGTMGKATGTVGKQASKQIKAERKRTGEYLYEKEFYGKRSVNQTMPSVKVKPSSGRTSSGVKRSAVVKTSPKKKMK